MIFYSVIFGIFGLGGAFFFFKALGSQRRHSQLLCDLGLEQSWTGQGSTPFYKWGWRKKSAERVWGERILQDAFKKAGIWLSVEDLLFFESICKQQESGSEVDLEKVKSKVTSIGNRMDSMRSVVASSVREILHKVMMTSSQEAKSFLESRGIHAEEGKVLSRFATYELRHGLREIGRQILGADSKGIAVKNSDGEVIYRLRGNPAWKLWLDLFTEEIGRQCSVKSGSSKALLFAAIRKNVANGLFKDYEDDNKQVQQFITAISKEIEVKELEITVEQAEFIDAILYTWQFSEGVRFNQADHKRMRELLSSKELSPHFRQIVMEKMKPDISSAKDVLNQFPKRVIFYGANDDARNNASESYYKHLKELITAFSSIAEIDPEAPESLKISNEEFYNTLKEAGEKLAEMNRYSNKRGFKDAENDVDLSGIHNLIERQKKSANRLRNLTYENAERKGWVINIPISDDAPETFGVMKEHPFNEYARFNCDSATDVDFKGITFQARKQRRLFFSVVLDVLTNRAEFDTDNGKTARIEARIREKVPVV